VAVCAGIRRDGTRCTVGVSPGAQWCYNHDPARQAERRRNAARGGKARASGELAGIKARLSDLADDVLEEKVDKGAAAVAGQLLNTYLRAVSVELKVRGGGPRAAHGGAGGPGRGEKGEAAVGGVRERLRRLEREAREGAVLIQGRDGSVKAFDKMHVLGQLYLAKLDAALGRPRRSSGVLDALGSATPESRRAVEEMNSGGFTQDLEPREPVEPVEDLSEQLREPL
jgi:hypothetical protein